MTERRDGWGRGSYRLATITGLIFLAGMYYLVHVDHMGWAMLCGLVAAGNFFKAAERSNASRTAKFERRLEKLVRR